MIIRSTPLGSPWKRGAGAFFICNSLSIFFIWMAFDITRKPENFTGGLWLAVVACSAVAYVFGMIFHVTRLKYVVLILGLLGAIPLFILSSISFFVFVELAQYGSLAKLILVLTYFGIIVLWGGLSFIKTMKLEKEANYLTSGIFIDNPDAYFSPDDYPDLYEFNKAGSKNLTAKQIFSVTAPVSLLGYPLQRYITDAGGYAATFAFISVLSVPLSIYFAGKIFSGYCLWIHLGNRFEKKNKVKIFLRP